MNHDSGTISDRPQVLRRRLPNSLLVPGALMLVLATVFVAARFERAASGDVSRFVVAGSEFTNFTHPPPGLHVVQGAGYDGQFMYRLALDPLDLRDRSRGIRFDIPLRRSRIAYPGFAFLFSGGDDEALPWSLVLVNIGALVALAMLGGVLAREAGRHPVWGLWLALYFGFVFSVARDLSEVIEAGFIVAALVALRRDRVGLAATALSLAVLTREAALVIVGAYAIWRVIEIARKRAKPGRADLPWIVPGFAFFAWQMVCLSAGPLPLANSGGNGVRIPGAELLRAIPHWADHLGSGSGLLQVAEGLTLIIVLFLAIIALRSSAARPYEKLAFAVLVIFAFTLSTPEGPWIESFDFRVFSDCYLLAFVVLIGTRKRLYLPVALVSVCWLGAAAFRIGTI